jgi:predicted ATPase
LQRISRKLRPYLREARAAQEAAERLIALSAERGITDFLAVATMQRGWAMAKQGGNEGDIARIREGLAAQRATGAEVTLPYYLSWLAEAYGETGRLDDGLGALTKALAAADEHEDRFWKAEIHRLEGELLLRQDHSKAAFSVRSRLRAKQSARSLELRATVSLARLLAKQGRRDEARTMLAEIYGWCTEASKPPT